MGGGLNRALVALALLAVPPGAAAQTGPFFGIPNIVFSYYDVAGSDAAAIRADINRRRPTDPNDSKRVDALSNTNWRLSWDDTAEGCDPATAVITFAATVRLPRLADPDRLAPDAREAWNRYIAALEAHEAWHVRNGYDGRLEILAAVQAATCATANDAARAAIATVNARDLAYDRATRHGEDSGASF